MALLTLDEIGSSRAVPPDPVLVQVVGDDTTLKAVQVIYRNLSAGPVTLHVENASSGFSQDVIVPAGTSDTTINIPSGKRPAITLGGPYGFRIPGWDISLTEGG